MKSSKLLVNKDNVDGTQTPLLCYNFVTTLFEQHTDCTVDVVLLLIWESRRSSCCVFCAHPNIEAYKPLVYSFPFCFLLALLLSAGWTNHCFVPASHFHYKNSSTLCSITTQWSGFHNKYGAMFWRSTINLFMGQTMQAVPALLW